MALQNLKWTQIIENENQIIKKSALYIIPLDDETCKVIIVDDEGNRRELSTAPSSDKYYVHEQTVESATWTINHPLNKYASVTLMDEFGNKYEAGVRYVSTSQIIIENNPPMKGRAVLN